MSLRPPTSPDSWPLASPLSPLAFPNSPSQTTPSPLSQAPAHRGQRPDRSSGPGRGCRTGKSEHGRRRHKISNAPDHGSATGALIAQIEKERDLERSRRQGLDTKSTELLKENAACTKITELEAQVHDPASLAEDTKIEELKARLSDALTKKSRVNSELQAIRTQLKDAQDAADKTHKYHLAALDNLKKAANVQ